MYMEPVISLVIAVMFIIAIYCIGLWAGRTLERHIVADRIAEAKKLAEEKKKARKRLY